MLDLAKEHDFILTVSDLHIPFHHPDVFAFLQAIKDKHWKQAKNPLCVIGGDELTWGSISFHDKNPALPNPEKELDESMPYISKLIRMFPTAYILESNHGSLVYRKQKHHGLPRTVFKGYNEILGAPKTWKWVPHLTVRVPGQRVYFVHGKTKDVTKLSKNMSMCAVQFHYHENFKIEYWANTEKLYWSMQAACLIDNNSAEFDYNKLFLQNPIIGTGVIVNGHPKLYPMQLNAKGRWTGKLV